MQRLMSHVLKFSKPLVKSFPNATLFQRPLNVLQSPVSVRSSLQVAVDRDHCAPLSFREVCFSLRRLSPLELRQTISVRISCWQCSRCLLKMGGGPFERTLATPFTGKTRLSSSFPVPGIGSTFSLFCLCFPCPPQEVPTDSPQPQAYEAAPLLRVSLGR